MTRRLFVPLILLALVSFAACNTVAGFGKDVQKVGRKMERSAERHSR